MKSIFNPKIKRINLEFTEMIVEKCEMEKYKCFLNFMTSLLSTNQPNVT